MKDIKSLYEDMVSSHLIHGHDIHLCSQILHVYVLRSSLSCDESQHVVLKYLQPVEVFGKFFFI